jgi:hypothetical protein
VVTSARPDDGDEEQVIDHTPCACGRLAAVVLVGDDLDVSAVVKCGCGMFTPPGTGGRR